MDNRHRLERPALAVRLATVSATTLLVVILHALPTFGPPPIGDHHDLRVTTKLARQMIAELGLATPDDHEISDHAERNLDGLDVPCQEWIRIWP